MSFILRWKPSVMPLLRVKRHMRTISSVQRARVWPRVQAGSRPLDLSVSISASNCRITELLEKQGIRVIEINEAIDHFDGCQPARLNVIVASGLKELPVTRKRFALAHELGHLLLDPALAKHHWDEKQLEKFMNGSASEFLFPSRAVRTFFGGPRMTVTIEELMSAKLRYGISICAIVYAMHELELISDNANQRFLTKTRNEWRDENRIIREPGDAEVNQFYCEKPERFEHLVMRGLAEGNLSLSRAAGLLGKRLSDIRKGAAPAVE